MNTRDRERFIAQVAAVGVSLHDAQRILRNGATLQRLAEAQCNGDWPCDNGEREVKPCERCASYYAPSALTRAGLCPDCRAEDRIKAILAPYGFAVEFHGDPRGAVVKVILPGGREAVAA